MNVRSRGNVGVTASKQGAFVGPGAPAAASGAHYEA